MTKNNEIEMNEKLEQAFALQQRNEVDAAIDLFQNVLSSHPNQPDALHGLGMSYAQKRDFEKAISYLAQAVNAAPNVAEFHNNLGNAYQAAGKVNEAMRHYHEALRLKSSYAQANNNLGTLLYRLGRYEEAATYFQKSIRIDPHALDTHYNLANCYIQLDRLLDAVPHYQEVLKIRGDHLGALHNLGITLCGLKRFEEAEPLLTQVIAKEPKNIDALFHLGVIDSALAKANEAIECYEKVLAINPQHAHSHHNLATIYLHLNEKEKALQHYQKALQLEPKNQTAQHMVDALMRKTNVEGAPTEYTRALFDQYAYSYETQVKGQLQYRVPQLLREAVGPFIKQTQELLIGFDLGCGTGLCAPLFADIIGKLIGVDVSPNMIEVARSHGGYYKLYVTDILSFLERPSEKVEADLIIAADVFVYFGSLEKVFQACQRTLKQNAFFCFSVELLTPEEAEHDPRNPHFQLRSTGRYAHRPDYIQSLCKMMAFKIEVQRTENIRYQEDKPVVGNIYVVRKL